MDIVNWSVYADKLKRVFEPLLTCSIYRSSPSTDAVGGTIHKYELLHEDVPCQVSHAPRPTLNQTLTPGVVPTTTHLCVHVHPDVDVRDGDELVLNTRPNRRVLVTRIACYTTHTRLEVAPIDSDQCGF